MTRILLVWSTAGFVSVCQSVPDADVPRRSVATEVGDVANALSGEWSIEFTIRPNEALPKGGTGHGKEVWKAGPGGLSLVEEYQSVGDDGDNTGLGIFWWEEKSHRFQVLWCANDEPDGCEAISDGAIWQNRQLVLVHRWESHGKQSELREVFSEITPSSFTQTIYRAEIPGAPNVAYVFHAKRKSGPSSS